MTNPLTSSSATSSHAYRYYQIPHHSHRLLARLESMTTQPNTIKSRSTSRPSKQISTSVQSSSHSNHHQSAHQALTRLESSSDPVSTSDINARQDQSIVDPIQNNDHDLEIRSTVATINTVRISEEEEEAQTLLNLSVQNRPSLSMAINSWRNQIR
ncbi:hypothetical protein PSTG_10348 [Puccinia striiformis f. sp. tritici PST-78]|uniref:Uncharacterized protein n=1 Tax=Puccinia striiformis f. sp. tritici PST-78 TaxID=1165861 RepID=A0A0L0VAZ6_9BASI|nr:hypothetical protein PSTG_10348 [Puccinia striiformis f. sp. tritici PST-78]